MLAKARALCEQQRWTNIELAQDAAPYIAPEPLDAVLFGQGHRSIPCRTTSSCCIRP